VLYVDPAELPDMQLTSDRFFNDHPDFMDHLSDHMHKLGVFGKMGVCLPYIPLDPPAGAHLYKGHTNTQSCSNDVIEKWRPTRVKL